MGYMKLQNKLLPLLILFLLLTTLIILGNLRSGSNNLRSNAASSFSVETESGTRSSGAQLLSDAAASGGQFVLLGLIPSITPTPTSTKSLYVSPTGSDSNSGTTSQTPFKTIQKALNVVTPGTTIFLAKGEFHEILTTKVNGTASAPIIIQGSDVATDITKRHQTVIYGSGRIVNIDHSYYTLTGFSIDGQAGLKGISIPTDPTKVIPFKDANRSKIVDSKLIYVGSADTTKNLTNIKITNMYLRAAGTECVRLRNATLNSEVSNSVIEYCGMFYKDNGDQFNYHNGEGVYIGTSPKSTTQPMYTNDTSNNNVVKNNTIYTYGSECFNVKENAHHNSFLNNVCKYNLEPLTFSGSNIELRGDHNLVADNQISESTGWNVKLKSDSSTYDKGGNTIQRNILSHSSGANIHTEQTGVLFCGNSIDSTVEGTTTVAVTKSC